MLIRPILIAFAVLFVSQLGQSASADENVDKWIKYFVGDWEREGRIWTEDDGWNENTISWSCELVAGGTTSISKASGGDWGDFVTVMGTDGHSGKLFEYGSAANGNRWRIVFETIESDKLTGKLLAGLGDGTKGEGELAIIRTGDDTYEAKWRLSLASGKEMKGTAKNKRK